MNQPELLLNYEELEGFITRECEPFNKKVDWENIQEEMSWMCIYDEVTDNWFISYKDLRETLNKNFLKSDEGSRGVKFLLKYIERKKYTVCVS